MLTAQAQAVEAKTVRIEPPSVSNYVDFRLYLKDFYEFKRKTESSPLRPYSYSHFSASADIKSPNYLKLVIDGDRNLSEQMALKFGKAMRLNRQQIEEFVLLVKYGQERDPQARSNYLRALTDYRFKFKSQVPSDRARTLELVTNWMTYVLYHMADQEGVSFEPEKLRDLIRTQTHTEEIRRAFEKLLETGVLARNADDGRVFKDKELLDDAHEIPVELIKKMQSELMFLGMESLFNDSPTDREFGGMTVALTEEEFQRFKFELRHLRKKWQKDIAVNRKATKGERIYQLNIQLFPVTKKSSNL